MQHVVISEAMVHSDIHLYFERIPKDDKFVFWVGRLELAEIVCENSLVPKHALRCQ